MEKLQFKTNINCGGCVKGVTPFLNEIKEIKKWSVDTDIPEKVLTIEGDSLDSQKIIEAVEDAGFDIVAM